MASAIDSQRPDDYIRCDNARHILGVPGEERPRRKESFGQYTRCLEENDRSRLCRLWRKMRGDRTLPPSYVDIHRLSPEEHLRMQAAIQPYIDNAISKTINIPEDFDFHTCQSIYVRAYAPGLNGCTTFRSNPVTGAVLTS